MQNVLIQTEDGEIQTQIGIPPVIGTNLRILNPKNPKLGTRDHIITGFHYQMTSDEGKLWMVIQTKTDAQLNLDAEKEHHDFQKESLKCWLWIVGATAVILLLSYAYAAGAKL